MSILLGIQNLFRLESLLLQTTFAWIEELSEIEYQIFRTVLQRPSSLLHAKFMLGKKLITSRRFNLLKREFGQRIYF